MSKSNEAAPGDGLRSVRTTSLFKAVNFELYVKPVRFEHFDTNILRLSLLLESCNYGHRTCSVWRLPWLYRIHEKKV